MIRTLLILALLSFGSVASAQTAPDAQASVTAMSELQTLLQGRREMVEKPSRKSVNDLLDGLVASGLPGIQTFLERWRDKGVWQHNESGLFFIGGKRGGELMLGDVADGATPAAMDPALFDQLKPNSGVRREIASALVRFQLSDPDPARRADALAAIERSPSEDQLVPLRGAIDNEADPALLARKTRLERLLTASYGETPAERVAAIESFRGATGVDVRGALSPILNTRRTAADSLPDTGNIARVLTIGTDIPLAEAHAMAVEAGLAEALVTRAERDAQLVAAIEGGRVAGLPVAGLNTESARDAAYAALTGAPRDIVAGLPDRLVVYDIYTEPDATVTEAARKTLESIQRSVALSRLADLLLDGMSLASIYFLAAIGLAITFGVMGVINMAHGEFITMGAYTGYLVQQIVPDYTIAILVALPLAFIVAATAGIALERLVIRHLYRRPLETLLATFGISIALQQLFKTIFGTQARPLTSPDWLAGAWALNDIVSVSYIRIAIFVLALAFLGLLLFILGRTRLGLEMRAVTQNPGMAGSVGIDPDRINMLTFGLGSGIAGIAGVAIGLYAKVTSEMGSDYIVQSFMTVVVGGVGNVWGTLAGAGLIGFLQKGIEWLNPSNTLAAQTYMILFIILFIQIRPRGIIALRGRAAGA